MIVIKLIKTNNPHAKTSKKYKQMITGICSLQSCRKRFERKYQEYFVEQIYKRGYVGCSKSCAAYLREMHMSSEVYKQRSEKHSVNTTRKNKKMWKELKKDTKRYKEHYKKIAKTTSISIKKMWDERYDEIIDSWQNTLRNKSNLGNCVSNIELAIRDLLYEVFGKDDVIHWARINNWIIDFYIKSLDLYIEVDGIYWHGLNKPLSEINKATKTSVRAQRIMKCYFIDRKKDKYFINNNMKLSRIREDEIKLISKKNIVDVLYRNIVIQETLDRAVNKIMNELNIDSF